MRLLYGVLMSILNSSGISVKRTMTTGRQRTKINRRHVFAMWPWGSCFISLENLICNLGINNSTCLLGIFSELNKMINVKYLTHARQINSKSPKQMTAIFLPVWLPHQRFWISVFHEILEFLLTTLGGPALPSFLEMEFRKPGRPVAIEYQPRAYLHGAKTQGGMWQRLLFVTLISVILFFFSGNIFYLVTWPPRIKDYISQASLQWYVTMWLSSDQWDVSGRVQLPECFRERRGMLENKSVTWISPTTRKRVTP